MSFTAHSALAQAPLDEVTGARLVCAEGAEAALAQARQLRGMAAATAAGVWPNPSLFAEHQGSLTGEAESQNTLGLSVPIGVGGRRFLLDDAGLAERDRAEAEASATLLEAALDYRAAHVAAIVARARWRTLQEHQARIDGLSVTIRGLSKGGEAAQYDLLRQESYAGTHRRLEALAHAKAESALIMAQSWTKRTAPLVEPSLLDLAGGTASDRAITLDEVRHPRMVALKAEALARRWEARAAARQWVPDLGLFAGYREVTVGAQTGQGVSLSISVPLTFFDHGQGEEAIALAGEASAEAELDRLQRRTAAELEATGASIAILKANLDADESARATALELKAEQLYRAGESSITEVLEVFRAAEEARLGFIDLAEEVARLRLTRMNASGSSFDPELDRACTVSARGAP